MYFYLERFEELCQMLFKETGEELALSEKTISTYRARVLEKMNMKSNSEMTHYAIKLDLVD